MSLARSLKLYRFPTGKQQIEKSSILSHKKTKQRSHWPENLRPNWGHCLHWFGIFSHLFLPNQNVSHLLALCKGKSKSLFYQEKTVQQKAGDRLKAGTVSRKQNLHSHFCMFFVFYYYFLVLLTRRPAEHICHSSNFKYSKGIAQCDCYLTVPLLVTQERKDNIQRLNSSQLQ